MISPNMINERGALVIEALKLVNFLSNNQLVQANAISQKIESMLEKTVMIPGKKPEEHPYWGAYHCSIRVRNYVLSGKTENALADARELGQQL